MLAPVAAPLKPPVAPPVAPPVKPPSPTASGSSGCSGPGEASCQASSCPACCRACEASYCCTCRSSGRSGSCEASQQCSRCTTSCSSAREASSSASSGCSCEAPGCAPVKAPVAAPVAAPVEPPVNLLLRYVFFFFLHHLGCFFCVSFCLFVCSLLLCNRLNHVLALATPLVRHQPRCEDGTWVYQVPSCSFFGTGPQAPAAQAPIDPSQAPSDALPGGSGAPAKPKNEVVVPPNTIVTVTGNVTVTDVTLVVPGSSKSPKTENSAGICPVSH